MKTVCHVVEATATGTLSMVVLAANAAMSNGSRVHVIYSPRDETPSDLPSLFGPGVKFHVVQMGGIKGLLSLLTLRNLFQSISPDIIHLHSSFAGFIGRLAAFMLPNTKLFYSPHCISFMRRDVFWRKYIFVFLEKIATIRSCVYVACSDSERLAIHRWLRVEASIVENAVQVAGVGFRGAQRFACESDPLVVVTVGGVRPQKDPALYAELARRCAATGINAEFIWIGDGDPALKARLLQAGVTVTGWLKKDDVFDVLRKSSLYLSTSAWEGMPIAIIEAMAIGVPVIATACVGNVDVIENGRTGFLFQSADEAYEVIHSCINGEVDLAYLASEAFIDVRSRFSFGEFCVRLKNLYSQSATSA